MDIIFKHRDQYYAVLDTDAEECDEADARRNAEIGMGDKQRRNAANDRERYVQ